MDRLKYKLMAFMQGRYGQDDLYKGCLILYVVLLVLNLFLSSKIISALLLLLLIVVFFRFFSKNISARQKENAKYLIIKNETRNKFSLFKKQIADKEHVYRKCPRCRAIIRFPRKKGHHDAVCPKCSEKFKVNIIF